MATNHILPPVVKGIIKTRRYTPRASVEEVGIGKYYIDNNGDLGYVQEFLDDHGNPTGEDYRVYRIEDMQKIYGQFQDLQFLYSFGEDAEGTQDLAVVFFNSESVRISYTRLHAASMVPVPAGTDRIDFSELTTVDFTANLVLNDPETEYDATADIMNWPEAAAKWERKEFEPVYTELDFPLQFRGGAAALLQEQFETAGLYALAWLEIYKRSNHAPYTYEMVKRTRFLFGEYAQFLDHVEISAAEENLQSVIDAYDSADYDIPVRELDLRKWLYEPLTMLNVGSWTIPEGSMQLHYGAAVADKVIKPFVNFDNAELVRGGTENDFKTQEESHGDSVNNGKYFFESAFENIIDGAEYSTTIRFRCKFNGWTIGEISPFQCRLVLARIPADGSTSRTLLSSDTITHIPGTNVEYYIDFNEEVQVFYGDKLTLYFEILHMNTGPIHTEELNIAHFDYMDISYNEASRQTFDIQTVDPVSLAQRLVDNMSSVRGLYKCRIHWKDAAYTTRIVAAESIRDFEKPYIHTNFRDFTEWMKFLGYEYRIDGNDIEWRQRDYWFDKSVTAMEIGPREVAALNMSADDSYAWSKIEIGYDAQDYDKTCGKLEPMGAYTYETDYKAPLNGKADYELKSPYRADTIGIELLTWTRTEKATDKDSNDDIFFIAAVWDPNAISAIGNTSEGRYKWYKDMSVTSSISEYGGVKMTTYNAPFNPRLMAIENQSIFGINAERLYFSATDGCRIASMNNRDGMSYPTDRDIPVEKQLFRPMQYSFAHGSHLSMPKGDALRGVVRFIWRGQQKSGFISRMAKNFFDERTDSDWVLDVVE